MKIKEPEWWIGVVAVDTVRIGNVWERIEERELRTDQPEKGCLPWGRWRRWNIQDSQTIFKGFTSPLRFFHCSFQSLFTLHSFSPPFCLSSVLPFHMVYKKRFIGGIWILKIGFLNSLIHLFDSINHMA